MDPAIAANIVAERALMVSILALCFSVLAAGFTGWQAWTAHLERTRPRPAVLVMPPAEVGAPRTIKNEGGSAAHSIQILVWGIPSSYRSRREAARKLLAGATPKLLNEPVAGGRVRGSLPAGEIAAIEGIGPRAQMFGPRKEGQGREGLDILYSPAFVEWKDVRGKTRHAWIEIR